MTDQLVRLAMAIVIIALISATLYHFSGRAGASEQRVNEVTLKR